MFCSFHGLTIIPYTIDFPRVPAEPIRRGSEGTLCAQGVEKDEVKGVEWLLRAANFDHPKAIYFLAHSFEYGVGVEENLDKAQELYVKAAVLGEYRAVEKLLVM